MAVNKDDPFSCIWNFQDLQNFFYLHARVKDQGKLGFSTPGIAPQGGKEFYCDYISQGPVFISVKAQFCQFFRAGNAVIGPFPEGIIIVQHLIEVADRSLGPAIG